MQLFPRPNRQHHRFQDSGDVAEDVSTHFRVRIPSGQSLFTVQVPLNHIKSDPPRRFYFKHLEVIPDFFSLEAEKLKLDTDPQMDRTVERDVQVRIFYTDPKTVYGSLYDHGNSAFNTVDFLKKINAHFESKKPNFAHTTPFFLDWIDTEMEKNETSAKYVPELPLLYYNEEYEAAKHFDFLPTSARGIDGVNNFLPPVSGQMDPILVYLSRIRLRLWMAPYTKAVFSNVNLFTGDLGFGVEQMGKIKYKQYHLINDKAYWLPVAVAKSAPQKELSGNQPFKLTLQASDNLFSSRIKHVAMVQRDWLDDAKLSVTLEEAVKQASRSFNVAFSLAYDAASKKFSFSFPEESDVVVVSIVCDPEFSHRLGFGYGTLITKGMSAEAQRDKNSVKDSQLGALAVVYDTGPIICQLDQTSSNTTSGLIDKTVASLYPNRSGTLRMPPESCSCALHSRSSASSFGISINTHSMGAYYPVRFHLMRIYDDGSRSDFQWNCDSFAYGMLVGTCCLSENPFAPHRV